MKYLKLKTREDLGGKHITFMYFGTEKVDPKVIDAWLKEITLYPQRLRNPFPDVFGENLGVMRYSTELPAYQIVREEILRELGPNILSQNYLEWKPHITGVGMDWVKERGLETIHVTGLVANDGSWSYDFKI